MKRARRLAARLAGLARLSCLACLLATGCEPVQPLRNQSSGERLVNEARTSASRHDGASVRSAVELLGSAELAFDREGRSEPAQRARLERAKLLLMLGETDEAASLLDSLFERVPSEARALRVEVLNALAPAKRTAGELDEARRFASLALELSDELSEPTLRAYATFNLGLVDYSEGRMDEALQAFRASGQTFKEENDAAGEARCHLYQGYALSNLGEEASAIEAYETAVALWKQSGDPRGLVQTLRSLGLLHAKRGDYRQALALFSQAETRLRPLADPVTEASLMTAMGQAYSDLGRPLLAVDSYESAVTKYRETHFVQGELVALLELGRVYASLGDLSSALEHLEASAELQRELGTSHLEKATLGHMASAYRQISQLDTAREILERALSSRASYEDDRELALHLNDLGLVHLELGNFAGAEARLLESLSKSRTQYRFIEFESLFGLARLRSREGRSEQALKDINEALAVSEALRERVASDAFRSSYFETVHEAHRFKVRLLLALDRQSDSKVRLAEAFEASEGVRARVLLDALWRAGASESADIPEPLARRERELRERIEVLASARPEDPKKAHDWDRQMRAATSDYDQLQGDIAHHLPAVTTPRIHESISLESLRRDHLDRETLLLEYVLLSDQSYVFAIRQDRTDVFELAPGLEIESLARRYYDLMTRRRPGQERAQESAKLRALQMERDRGEIDSLAERLYRLLLAPVDLEGIRRLIVVADGTLNYVPFSSLRVDDNYLLDRFEIVKVPSAASGAALRGRSVGRSRTGIVVLADPVFQSDDPRVRRARPLTEADRPGSKRSNRFGRLIGTRREARAIRQTMGDGVRLALDFDANRSVLTEPQSRRARIIHLATHGFADDTHPSLSGIVLALRDPEGSPLSGYLRLPDIYALDLESDLVVLSACDTALGQRVSGEGIVGLVRAFLMAGASQVLATLWRVNDTATGLFMEYFYGEIARGLSPSNALRIAQQRMAQHPRFGAPFFWSAFELHGDWSL